MPHHPDHPYRTRSARRWAARCAAALLAGILTHASPAPAQVCGSQWLSAFGIPGVAPGSVGALATWDPDGAGPLSPQVVIAGSFSAAGDVAASNVARWDGAAWGAFSTGLNAQASALTTWDPDGDEPQPPALIVAGSFTTASGDAALRIARWNSDHWSPIAEGFDAPVNALISWDPDGAGPRLPLLIAAGVFLNSGPAPINRIAQWDGVQWSPLGLGLDGPVFALTVWDPDSEGPASPLLIAGGDFDFADGVPASNIAAWNGDAWAPLAGGADGPVNALVSWDPDHAGPTPALLYAGGSFTNAGGNSALRIASWDGAAWASLSFGMNDAVSEIIVHDPDGEGPLPEAIIASGSFTTAGPVAAVRTARWNGVNWSNLTEGISGSTVTALASWDPDGSGPSPTLLIAGGNFNSAGTATVRALASWNESSWSALGMGTDAPIAALLAWDSDGAGPTPDRLYLAGQFRTIAGQPADRIASWDGARFDPLGAGTPGEVIALSTWDSDGPGSLPRHLVAGGNFTTMGGVAAARVARWDGAAWHPLSGGITEDVVRALTSWDPDGPGPIAERLVAGGAYINIVGQPGINRIAQYDGSSWTPIAGPSGNGVSDTVLALTSWDPDAGGPESPLLVAGGQFITAGGVTVNRIAAYEAGQWVQVGFSPVNIGANGIVFALTTWDPDGAAALPPVLVAAGSFTSIDGVAALRIARWNGFLWDDFNVGFNGTVRALTTFDPDGAGPLPADLIAAGDFSMANGAPIARIARWNGASWQPIGGVGPDGSALALASWDPDTAGPAQPRLAVAGNFTRIGADVSAYLGFFGRETAAWSNPSNGFWNTPSDWLCGVSPSPLDRVIIDNTAASLGSGAFSITLPPSAGTVGARSMRVSTNNVELVLNQSGLALSESAGSGAAPLIVGDQPSEPAALTLRQSGSLHFDVSASGLVIADSQTLTPQGNLLSLPEPGARLNIEGDLFVARRGNSGELQIRNGAHATVTGAISVGTEQGAVGSLVVSGAGTQFTHSSTGRSFVVGQQGAGTLRIGGVGSAAGAHMLSIGRLDTFAAGTDPTGVGSVIIAGTGTRWDLDAERFYIALAGPASLTIEAGAVLETNVTREVVIGGRDEAPGSLLIRGASRWTSAGASISIARAGSALLGSAAILDAATINIRPAGTIAGDGQIGSLFTILNNFGVLDPRAESGNASGSILVQGDYRQAGIPSGTTVEAGGLLDLTIWGSAASPDPDRLHVTQESRLAGALIVRRAPSFTGLPTAPVTLVESGAGFQGFFDVAFLPSSQDVGRFFRVRLESPARGPMPALVLDSSPLADFITLGAPNVDSYTGNPAAATTGDFNNDGQIDVAIIIPDPISPTTSPGDLALLINDGSLNGQWLGWTTTQFVDAIPPDARDIASGDIDNDKWDDIIVPTTPVTNMPTATAFRNNQAGGFLPSQSFPVGAGPVAIALADLDGDGFVDAATANATDGTITLLRNLGGVGPAWQGFGVTLNTDRADIFVDPSSLAPAPSDIIVVPLNGLGQAELVTANQGSSSISIISNEDSAVWAQRFTVFAVRRINTPPGALISGDIDNDKWDDIIIVPPGGTTTTVVVNDTDGNELRLRPPVDIPTGANPSSATLADLDADNDLDLAVIATNEFAQRAVRIFRNDIPPLPQPGDAARVVFAFERDLTDDPNPALVLSGDVNPGVDPQARDELIVLSGSDPFPRPGAAEAPDRGAPPVRQASVRLAVPPCRGDADRDGLINFADITSILQNWGSAGPLGDADDNGLVSFSDVTAVLDSWGNTCP